MTATLATASSKPPSIVTLVLLCALTALSLNMFLPSIVEISQDFETSYAVVGAAIAAYLGFTAVLQLLLGPLSDRYGRRPVLLVCITIFTFASAGCWLSTNIWQFMIFRMLQGFVIGAWAISMAIIRDNYPPAKAASMMGYVAMAMAMAPMTGPMLGGVLAETFDWRANFLLYLILGCFIWLMCWFDLSETSSRTKSSLAQQWQETLTLIQSPIFWGFTLSIAFGVSAFYTFISGIPALAEPLFALAPTELGFYMGTITAGYMLGNYLSGRYATLIPLGRLIIIGRTLGVLGLTTGLVIFTAGYGNLYVLIASTLCAGLGNGLSIPAANASALSVYPQLSGTAAGISGAATVASGGVFTVIISSLLALTTSASILLLIMLACALLALVLPIWLSKVRWSSR